MHRAVATICLALLSSSVATSQKHRKDVPVAPLPGAVLTAKRAFLSNGGGSDLAYDAFYSGMKTWDNYPIADSPADADLIVELAYRVLDRGTRVWRSTDTSSGVTNVHSKEITDPQLVLTIYDAKTKNSLWATIAHRRLARFEKNREKETINSAEQLVDELKTRSAGAQ